MEGREGREEGREGRRGGGDGIIMIYCFFKVIKSD